MSVDRVSCINVCTFVLCILSVGDIDAEEDEPSSDAEDLARHCCGFAIKSSTQ